MDINPLFLLEFVLFSGVALAWAGYEYWTVSRKDDTSAPPDETRHPEG
ncbi:MAG: hypothetical protein H7124_14795 [Phycisphaerales bacterium]|nr:hypothetical protein [Hyphomonadaceae bacterium]